MTDTKPYFKEYRYDFTKGMSVLDVLNVIHITQDSTLSYSYCCRNRHCGLCGLLVNGSPVLACKCAAQEELVLEPLKNLPVLKDLAIDRDEYESLRPQLRLFSERRREAPEEPEPIDPQRFEYFKVASRCIECFCCVSICPVYTKSPHTFAGPAALVLEARHFFDPRDELNRALIVNSEGISNCTQCGLCSKICGLSADPAGAIRRMLEES
jgi:succinate dehydrogenase/fumarate reductase iron-sulfur protein